VKRGQTSLFQSLDKVQFPANNYYLYVDFVAITGMLKCKEKDAGSVSKAIVQMQYLM